MIYVPSVAVSLGVTVSTAVIAQQSDAPLSNTVLSFEQRGYVVKSAEDEGRTHEIEAVAPDGSRVEAVIEASSGEVLKERPDNYTR